MGRLVWVGGVCWHLLASQKTDYSLQEHPPHRLSLARGRLKAAQSLYIKKPFLMTIERAPVCTQPGHFSKRWLGFDIWKINGPAEITAINTAIM